MGLSQREAFARVMEHLCTHSAHGYSQGTRWGNGSKENVDLGDGVTVQVAGGDRDCSSAIISALDNVGIHTDATYTGNMRSALLATGLFQWHDMSFTAQRGDIYLNEANHTAMCTSPSPDQLAEFSISETGGIYGDEGNQTGWEAHISAYYDYPWDGILHWQSDGDWLGEGNHSDNSGNSGTTDSNIPAVEYCVRVNGKWYSPLQNLTDTGGSGDDFAGDLSAPIEYLAVNMPGWYQVKTKDNGWLEAVSGYNTSDLENGCAGDGSPITAVRCYYETPDPNATGWLYIAYQVHTPQSGWLDYMHDLTDTGGSRDDFAGSNDEEIDGFRAYIAKE